MDRVIISFVPRTDIVSFFLLLFVTVLPVIYFPFRVKQHPCELRLVVRNI